MTKINVSELEGAALDWAVAVAMNASSPYGTKPIREFNTWFIPHFGEEFKRGDWNPSTDWSQGGELIEAMGIDLCCLCEGDWSATADNIVEAVEQGINESEGPTPLIAAMRAIVAAEIGDTVDAPEELL